MFLCIGIYLPCELRHLVVILETCIYVPAISLGLFNNKLFPSMFYYLQFRGYPTSPPLVKHPVYLYPLRRQLCFQTLMTPHPSAVTVSDPLIKDLSKPVFNVCKTFCGITSRRHLMNFGTSQN